MVPLDRSRDANEVHRCSRNLAQRVATRAPQRYITSAGLKDRSGKLFIDYLRDGRGTTVVGAYPRGVSSPRSLRQWLIPPTEPEPELLHADPTQIDARQERKCASEMN